MRVIFAAGSAAKARGRTLAVAATAKLRMKRRREELLADDGVIIAASHAKPRSQTKLSLVARCSPAPKPKPKPWPQKGTKSSKVVAEFFRAPTHLRSASFGVAA